MKILVLDTETTGLCNHNQSISETTSWPHVLQFSFILYDTDKHKILNNIDDIIYVPNYMDNNSREIHKISKNISKNRGLFMKDMLEIFNICLESSDRIVAHNLPFDKKMLMVEYIRNGINPNVWALKSEYCTMRKSTGICKLPHKSYKGTKSLYKYPSLSELYKFYFDCEPSGVHNSLIDILVCLRCYYMLEHNDDICKHNKYINAMFKKYKI